MGRNVVVTCPPDRVPLVGKEVRGSSIQAPTHQIKMDKPLVRSEQEYFDRLQAAPGEEEKKGLPPVKYIQRFAQHMRVVASTWSRILVLIWKTNPWYVSWLLVFTFLGGLIPSLQIQVTSQIIQNAAEAIQGGQAPQLVHLAIVFGFLFSVSYDEFTLGQRDSPLSPWRLLFRSI